MEMKWINGLRGIGLLATTLFAMSANAADVLVENAFLPGTGGAKGEPVTILISEGRIQAIGAEIIAMMLKGSMLEGRLSHQGTSIQGRV